MRENISVLAVSILPWGRESGDVSNREQTKADISKKDFETWSHYWHIDCCQSIGDISEMHMGTQVNMLWIINRTCHAQ